MKTCLESRRRFLRNSGIGVAGTMLVPTMLSGTIPFSKMVPVNAHLWVYASKFPPNWDATPVLDTIFSDLSYAGIEGLELMESILRHDNSVQKLKELSKRYNVPVSGSSYGVGFKMWDTEQHKQILDDIRVVIPRLSSAGGKTFGISVGSKQGLKTEAEFDAQAKLLSEIRILCNDHGIEPNLHNHTYEVENNLHDLKGTLQRLPDFKLGPDLNWLIRAGVDPVEFINTYGNQIIYLHIRDQYDDGTWTEYVGQGATNFKSIAKALQSVDFAGQVAIELAFPNDFTPEHDLKNDWKMSRDFVKDTFGW